MRAGILKRFDTERRAASTPFGRADIVRELAPNGSECMITFSRCATRHLDEAIRHEISRAQEYGYTLEWKVYEHDAPTGLKGHLMAAGFAPGPVEVVMVIPLNGEALTAFDGPKLDIKRIRDADGLKDVAAICREIGRTNVEEEMRSLARTLKNMPNQMSVHVAYKEHEPIACGRIYFKEHSVFAELCGGRTKTTHRNQGFYTAIVASRLREAMERNRDYVAVDALPTSEPILKRRGFQSLTRTQPFVYTP